MYGTNPRNSLSSYFIRKNVYLQIEEMFETDISKGSKTFTYEVHFAKFYLMPCLIYLMAVRTLATDSGCYALWENRCDTW